MAESRVLQENGPSAMREVSSAYWSKLIFHGEELTEYPKSGCLFMMLSTRVFVTVLNSSTESGSPWYTPIWRWMGLVVQDLVDTTPVRSWYRLEIVLIITYGAW